ncbi:GNAT family N-acetyltransferase [Pseudonocardia nantongensis]|uniref:GNAT family N-acetyltransferase n=1 Tax=Pseudonocardia nantongensis TaxID=1181885 RepID=UPI00397BB53A
MALVLRPARSGGTDGAGRAAGTDEAALQRLDAGTGGVLGDSGPGWHAAAAAAPDRVHLVLDDGAGLAGYLVLAGPRGPEPGVELHRLVVAVEHRGTGLGRALLRAALTLAAVPGAAGPDGVTVDPGWAAPPWLAAGRLWLEVAPDNRPALALYRAEGLVVETRLPSVPGCPTAPALRLVLARE